MDFGVVFRLVLESSWGHIGVILGYCWKVPEMLLARARDTFGVISGSVWGSVWGSFWGRFEIILGSCWRRF